MLRSTGKADTSEIGVFTDFRLGRVQCWLASVSPLCPEFDSGLDASITIIDIIVVIVVSPAVLIVVIIVTLRLAWGRLKIE